MTLFLLLKWLHVVLAILAVGANATYAIWLARAEREPEHRLHVLRGVKLIDDRMANPAYALLAVTGFAMVFTAGGFLQQTWLQIAIGLYATVIAVGLFGYTPTLRAQIASLASGGEPVAYARLAARGRLLGILLAIDVLAIVFLMVVKPGS